MDEEEPIPADADLKKRLFDSPSSVDKSQTPREEGGRSKGRGHHGGKGTSKAKRKQPKPGFRLGVFGVLLFLLLCALALVVTLKFNDDWKEMTFEDVKADVIHFFSNEPLREGNEQENYHLFGLLGALPLAAAISFCTGAFTCLFMYYDSDIPGDFPPTPVSPRKETDPSPSESKWHLGYIFVPVNTLVAFSLALFYLRLHMELPIV